MTEKLPKVNMEQQVVLFEKFAGLVSAVRESLATSEIGDFIWLTIVITTTITSMVQLWEKNCKDKSS